MVYDCGSNSKGVDNVIENSFEDSHEIDVLFISHFDEDHVNKIKILKKFKIKRVVMPLLDNDTKEILVGIYKLLGANDAADLISEPKKILGDSEIIYVEIDNRNEDNFKLENESEDNPDDYNLMKGGIPSKIKSGSHLYVQIDSKQIWSYIPYNYCFLNRKEQFKKLLEKHSINIEDIKNGRIDEQKRKDLRSIYQDKELDGSINENSMLLISNVHGNINIINELDVIDMPKFENKQEILFYAAIFPCFF